MLTLNVFVLTVHAQSGGDDQDENCFDVTLTQTSISKDYNDIPDQHIPDVNAQILPEHKHNKKFQSIKHITFEVTMPEVKPLPAVLLPEPNNNTPVLPKAYTYLYFTEINPPPPKLA